MFGKRLVRHPLAMAGVVAFLIAGCIISGQFVIVIDWGGTIEPSDPFYSEHIDLTGDETWQDHKDDIQSIVDIKFEVTIENEDASVKIGEVYVSANEYTNATDVQNNATRILHGIEVPGSGSIKIEFDESTKYQENLPTLLDLAESGQFWLYGLAEDAPYRIVIKQGSRILVTFSAG